MTLLYQVPRTSRRAYGYEGVWPKFRVGPFDPRTACAGVPEAQNGTFVMSPMAAL